LSYDKIEFIANKKSDEHGRAAAQAAILILETTAFLHHENIIEADFREAAMECSKEYPDRMEPEVENCIDQLLQLEKDQSWNQFFFQEGIRVLM
jgi:hypothetical protein